MTSAAGNSKKAILELWIVSIIAGIYFAMISRGGLCMTLFKADRFTHRCLLSVVLAAALWGTTLCFSTAAERIVKIHNIRNMVRSFLDTKGVLFFYILAVSRLTQAVFYPFYAEHKIYFVSYFLLGVYLCVVMLSYITGHEKYPKAVCVSTTFCFAAWCVSRILPEWHVVYDIFYYGVLLANMYFVLRLVRNVTVKDVLQTTNGWILRNKVEIPICLLAAIAGGCVEVAYEYFNHVQFMFPRCAFWAMIGFCIVTCVFLYRKKDGFIERTFACIALSVGIYMAIFMPLTTGVSWDDQIHYAHTLELVQGKNATEADRSMYWLEKGIHGDLISQEENKTFYHVLTEKAKDLSSSLNVNIDVQFHQKIGYIPNGVGLIIGQILNLPYGITFILGRMSGVVFYTLVMCAAMKCMIKGKLLLAIVALIPTNLFQSVNYTYDAWLVCMVAFAVSRMVGWWQYERMKIQTKEVVLVLAIMAIAIAPKGIYFPLFLLFLLVSRDQFTDRKQYKRYVLSVFGIMFACFFVYMLLPFLSGSNQGDTRFGTEISTTGQIIYILKNPFRFLKNLLLFLKGYLSLENSFSYTCFWAYLTPSWLDYHTTLMVLLFVVAIVDRGECDQIYSTVTAKLSVTILLYIIAALIATVLYLSCSPVGSDIINGCQPRYLAPLVFPFLIFVCNLGCFRIEKIELLQAMAFTLSGYVLLMILWANIAIKYIV